MSKDNDCLRSYGTSHYEVRVIDAKYAGSYESEKLLFTCKVNDKYPFWRNEEGAARLGKMLTHMFTDASTGPYADLAQGLKVQIVSVSETVREYEKVCCPNHAVLMYPDQECHICEQEKENDV
jgi:hypothetical protein